MSHQELKNKIYIDVKAKNICSFAPQVKVDVLLSQVTWIKFLSLVFILYIES